MGKYYQTVKTFKSVNRDVERATVSRIESLGRCGQYSPAVDEMVCPSRKPTQSESLAAAIETTGQVIEALDGSGRDTMDFLRSLPDDAPYRSKR